MQRDSVAPNQAKGHEALDFLRTLVALPSVSPRHAEGAPATALGEARAAEWLAAYLQSLGFKTALTAAQPGRPNLVARHGPAKPRWRLLFEAHLDTVGIGGMTVSPFELTLSDGRAYGRGACDTKGPLAALLAALDAGRLARLAAAQCEVIVVGAMGEEEGNVGIGELVAAGLKADQAVVLEPTKLEIVHAHKGAWWFAIETRGRAAHGSQPEAGRNAILDLVRLLPRLATWHRSQAALAPQGPLGPPTMNPGLIRGGQAPNVVPDFCRLEVDRRLVPGEDPARLAASLEELLETSRRTGEALEVSWSLLHSSPPFLSPPDAPLIRRLLAALAATDSPQRLAVAPWFSDAGPLATTCAETAVFGPGDIAQAHTADEYIEVEALERGARTFGALLDLTAQDLEAGAAP